MYLFKLMAFIVLFLVSPSYGEKCSPIPEDKTKLPASLQKEIKAIANLCELDTLEQKVRSLEKSLDNLKKCIPHYKGLANESFENFYYLRDFGLWTMALLYYDEEIQIYWESLFNDKVLGTAGNVLHEYLQYRARAFGLRSGDARDPHKAYTTFEYDWEHDVYRGFYCIDYIKPPPPYKRAMN